MNKILILSCLLVPAYGCMLGYTWVNTDYPEAEIRDYFVEDKGECMQISDKTYPDPKPVQDPDELYHECMSYYDRRESFPERAEDGSIVYRTNTRRANPYLCRPSRQHRAAYREYEYELRQQQSSRAKYVNSCMSMMGWERMKKQ